MNEFKIFYTTVRVFDKEFNMMKMSRMECVTRPLVATLLSLSLVMLLTGGAQAAVNCATCHGVVAGNGSGIDAHPVDTIPGSLPTYRNITTGAVKGNHNTHSGPSMVVNGCTKCHGAAVAAYSTKHAVLNHYSIQIGPAVRYNKYTSSAAFLLHTSSVRAFAQTTDPQLGKCSTANCHFESRTPVWGSDPLNGANLNTCSTCHNALPDTGSHTVHISEHGNDLNACSYCHSDHTAAAKPFQHATSVGRAITITPLHSYDGNGSNSHYLPSQAADRTFGNCATAYCHDDGLGNGAASLIDSPTWGSVVAKCNVCHLSRPASGSHIAHVTSVNIGCASCHKGAVEGASVPVNHVNGLIDVFQTTPGDLGYPAGKPKGSPYLACTNASCHASPTTGLVITTPTWGDSSTQKCALCHALHPSTGSHDAHFNFGLSDCSNCHKGAVDGKTVSTNHSNGLIDIDNASGALGYPTPRAIGSAASTCTTTICHNDGRGVAKTTPTWGTLTPPANCTMCHDRRPTTGSHSQHIVNQGVYCTNCHKGAVEGSTPPVLHLSNAVDVFKSTEGDMGYPTRKLLGSPYQSCNGGAANCHVNVSPQWGANTNNHQCTKCHGQGVPFASYSTGNRQSAPGYGGVGLGTSRQLGTITTFVSDDPKVGSHDTHMRSLNNLGKPVSCADCHLIPATPFSAGHMNGSSLPTWSNMVQNKETITGSAIPYTFGKGAIISTYDSATGTCSNIYCHGGTLTDGKGTSPKWNDSTYLTGDRSHDCQQCHGFPPTSSLAKKSHDPVLETNCASCHPHNGTRDATDVLAGHDFHINGNLEAMKYCNSCHDYDTRGPTGALWGKNQMATEGIGAHAVHVNYLKKRMNITTMDSNVDVYGSANFDGVCGVCHDRNQLNHRQTDRGAPRMVNFGDDVNKAALQFGLNPPQYNGLTGTSSLSTPKTCSNTSCHYKTSPIWQPY